MKIDQSDFDTFEAVIVHDMYKAREDKEHRDWFEQPSATQLEYRDVIDAWTHSRTVKFFSPIGGMNSAISDEARTKLRVLMAIKQAELKADFTGKGADAVFRALVSDMIEQFGWSERTSDMINILYALIIGPRVYEALFGHYPVNETKFVTAFAKNQYDACKRHY